MFFLIEAVFGLPGSGKTTYLSKLARQAQKSKIKVFSNFACHGCYKLNFDDLGKYLFENCLIIIDEISLICDSRDWKNFNSDLRYFFTNHRHYHIDIVYCSQWFTDTDIKIRRMTDSMYYIQWLPFGLSMRFNVVRDIKTNDSGEIVDTYKFKHGRLFYRPRYYKMFDSFSRRPLPEKDFELWSDV